MPCFNIRQLLPLCCLILTIGCATIKPQPSQSTTTVKSSTDQIAMMKSLTSWQINGKIAFLQENKRESASINWRKTPNAQQLNLTTYLGINVLSVKSNQYKHTINVDGNEYTGSNLDTLIYSLTQISLPAEALSYWIKGLPYQDNDNVQYSENSALATRLTSHYDNRLWQVDYSQYQPFKFQETNFMLPTKLTIKQHDLTIKLAIKHWKL